MKNLIIVGAGGMGRSFFDIAINCIGYMVEFRIKGFLDDNIHQLDTFENYPPVLGTIVDYIPEMDDVFTCSIGNVATKKNCCSKILQKGGKFITLVSKNAVVGKNAKIGEGAIIAPYAILGTDCLIGKNVLVQSFAVIGHAFCGQELWRRLLYGGRIRPGNGSAKGCGSPEGGWGRSGGRRTGRRFPCALSGTAGGLSD